MYVCEGIVKIMKEEVYNHKNIMRMSLSLLLLCSVNMIDCYTSPWIIQSSLLRSPHTQKYNPFVFRMKYYNDNEYDFEEEEEDYRRPSQQQPYFQEPNLDAERELRRMMMRSSSSQPRNNNEPSMRRNRQQQSPYYDDFDDDYDDDYDEEGGGGGGNYWSNPKGRMDSFPSTDTGNRKRRNRNNIKTSYPSFADPSPPIRQRRRRRRPSEDDDDEDDWSLDDDTIRRPRSLPR